MLNPHHRLCTILDVEDTAMTKKKMAPFLLSWCLQSSGEREAVRMINESSSPCVIMAVSAMGTGQPGWGQAGM